MNRDIRENETFESIFIKALDKHASYKKKIIRANQKPYMTRTLREAIMKRSELERRYFKYNSSENNKAYRQRGKKEILFKS